jgi:RNAse (barnase) inhibitor barstar
MTALTALLQGPAPGGVYRVPESTALADIERVASWAGWRVVSLDTTTVAGRAGVLGAMKEAFGFPDWFGHNLDALVDALRDVTFEPGTLLVWSGSISFAAGDPEQFEKVLAVLRSRAGDATAPRILTVLR